MEREKISVIVPIYNNEKHLENCLKSLGEQSYENIEFILIDDGSTDMSSEICKYFCSKDSRFKYLIQSNSGVSQARNRGLEIASGNLIGFCDGDDWVEPDIYECLYDLMQSNDAEIAICGYYLEKSSSIKINGTLDEIKVMSPDKAIELTLQDNVMGGFLWNKLFNRSKLGEFRLDSKIHIYEDLLLVCELYGKSNTIIFKNAPKYHYVQNFNSAIHKSFSQREWSRMDSCKRIIEICERNYPNSLETARKNYVCSLLIIINKLTESKSLSKTYFSEIKDEIKRQGKDIKKLLSKKSRFEYNIVMLSRRAYIIYKNLVRKVAKLKRK